MDSPPAALERRGYFSYFFSVSGRKEINPSPSGNFYRVFFFPPRIANVLFFRRIALYVCRPLNGKHKKKEISASFAALR